jgi:glycosyltransferase involved in cell wall biosynthesis
MTSIGLPFRGITGDHGELGFTESRSESHWFPLLSCVCIFLIAAFREFSIEFSDFDLHVSPEIVLASILIPNYNKGPYIARAVRSALSQTLSSLEIAISDDHSTDLPENLFLQLQRLDRRVRIWVNDRRLFSNWNRAKCVCRARGSWIFFLDSDDELMNRTAEIDFRAHQLTGADMVEHRILQVRSGGRICIFRWREAPFQIADNNTLTAAMQKGIMNWTLWRKMIDRKLYQRALVFLGIEACTLPIVMAEDRLHATSLYRFVSKFVTVEYFGSLYYLNIPDNSWNRMKGLPSPGPMIEKHVKLMLSRHVTDFVDGRAVCHLCARIASEIPAESCPQN